MSKATTIAIAASAMIVSATATTRTVAAPPAPTMPSPQGTGMPATKSGYAPVNGVSVYYAVYGQGAPIVLLHGGMVSMEVFGPVLAQLAENHQVIGIDLQAHGRTLPFDRPMSFEAMADDVAGVIRYLGLPKADVLGFSMGGGVALRVGIQHPDIVDRLVLVSTPYAYSGWHDYNQQGMRSIVPAAAEAMKQTPLYQAYAQVAPDVNNWPKLITQMSEFIGKDYDYSADVGKITAPTLLVVGDHDSVRPSHAVRFFELLGGGLVDAEWDGSRMVKHRLAIIPGLTHYTMFATPVLADTIVPFLDAPAKASN
jgi:pimeloyl-ACP methyl ester carboxylesterase